MLAIFSLNSAVTNYMWIMSAIIADLMVCYYGITETQLNFTTTSYMIVYLVLGLPSAWFMDKYGLRLPMVLTSATIALGASVRVIGTGKGGHVPLFSTLL
jgi:fucose permease